MSTTASPLIKLRGRLKGSLTRHKQYTDDIPPETTLAHLMIRMEKLEETWTNFIDIDDQVSNLVGQESNFDEFEDIYFESRATYQNEIQRLRVLNNPVQQNQCDDLNTTFGRFVEQQQTLISNLTQRNSEQSDLRLPKLNIKSFSGRYEDWPSFKDTYLHGVHDRNDIPDVNKFLFLKSVLTDEAASLIKHMLVTSENYQSAWDKLSSRYDRPRHIITAYIKLFIDQPVISNPTASNMRKLADTSDEVIRALTALGRDASTRDPWLIHLLMSKLDSETKQLWATDSSEQQSPTITDFLEFLNKRSDSLETVSSALNINSDNSRKLKSLYSSSTPPSNSTGQKKSSPNCPFCNTPGHPLFRCYKYKAVNLKERAKFVEDKKLCANCLHEGHSTAKCPSDRGCTKCTRRHHSSLHFEPEDFNKYRESNGNKINTPDNHSTNGICENNSSMSSYFAGASSSKQAASFTARSTALLNLLPTAIVNVPDLYGSMHACRVLLDSGSQCTLVTESFVDRLHLKRRNARIALCGISDSKAGFTKGVVTISLHSRFDKNKFINVHALILKDLTSNIPQTNMNVSECSHIKELELADPQYNQSQGIDMLIGSDYFFEILQNGKLNGGPNSPTAQSTLFGWVVAGPSDALYHDKANHRRMVNFAEVDLDRLLKGFWEVEEPPKPKSILSKEEVFCETHFKTHHRLDENSRFMVKLPFHSKTSTLGNSLQTAIARLKSIERKFCKNPDLKESYTSFLTEYESLGHMQCISADDVSTADHLSYYLPHHAVIKMSSSTTKCRVVFDGSARSSTGVSLNDILAVGPTIQPTLFSTLIRFRRHKIAFTADIEKMYRQVNVDTADQDFQRIVWRNLPTEPIRHYRLRTITYGTSSAPFLATRCLHQIGLDLLKSDPPTASIILNDFYIDDLISGASSLTEALTLKTSISNTLNCHGFPLRKWISNEIQFMKDIPTIDRELDIHNFDETSTVKILGLYWNPHNDCFSFKVSLPSIVPKTKRSILSESSKIFDPLGLVSPAVILVKILFQKLWVQGHDWDDTIPDHLIAVWITLRKELKMIENINVPRWLHMPSNFKFIGFADASESAFAAVIYCRSIDVDGRVFVNLVMSKTRVAPLKQISLPRLELCAAHLLANLFKTICEMFNITYQSCYAYTDSAIVLAWLSSEPRKWSTYVANRTSEILDIIPRTYWHHVPSKENAADIASRGVLPSSLVNLDLWWHGPQWLVNDESLWPVTNTAGDSAGTNIEQKTTNIVNTLLTSQCSPPNHPLFVLFTNNSSFSKIIRIICFVRRFLSRFIHQFTNPPQSNPQYATFISSNEIKDAHMLCVRWTQHTYYADEMLKIIKTSSVHQSGKLASLSPFIDENGILRVGGRLERSNCTFAVKHPIILPRDAIFTSRLLSHLHVKHLHAGPTLLQSILRQTFWVPKGRNMIRQVCNRCTVCFRYKQHKNEQLMADLSSFRTNPGRPFQTTGIDYAGPVQLRTHPGKSYKIRKGYIALFICFRVRALHLELVTDMTSSAFIAALKRFVARRGIPAEIYSDNGTNFVGACKQLKLDARATPAVSLSMEIADFLSENQISWHFIPPASPHFGGSWEIGVRSVKGHLKRVLGQQILTYEEFQTVLCQIEALLNSRPLCAISESDASHFDALTPAHFLIGSPTVSLPEPNLIDTNKRLINRWQHAQRIQQGFWSKWHTEYLTSLQNRPKWRIKSQNLEIGELVILKEDNVPPTYWPLARIVETHPGTDGLVRAVTIKTCNGVYKRPTIKICRLPLG